MSNRPRGARRARWLPLLLGLLGAPLLGTAAQAAASGAGASAGQTGAGVSAARAPQGAPAATGEARWEAIRETLFGERAIDSVERVLTLEAPPRALDGARVPIAVLVGGAGPAVRRLYLVVDNNPVPVAASFRFEPGVQWRSIDTELRVNEYSTLRAVAELADGSLDMSARFIKASGGCSAPPSSYERSDASALGSFRGGLDEILAGKRAVTARIRLVHPNASGMQFDQLTRTYIPAHFVHTMGATLDGRALFTLETNFSLSQDPVLGFDFRAPKGGRLTLYAIDSKGERFERSWPLGASGDG